MINWCENKITISGPSHQLNLFLQDAQTENDNLSLEKIAPIVKNNFPAYSAQSEEIYLNAWGTVSPLNISYMTHREPGKLTFICKSESTPPLQAFMTASQRFNELDFIIAYQEPESDICGQAHIKNNNMEKTEQSYSKRFGNLFVVDTGLLLREKDSVVIFVTDSHHKYPTQLGSNEIENTIWRCEFPVIFFDSKPDEENFFSMSQITYDEKNQRIKLNDTQNDLFIFKSMLYKAVINEIDNLKILFYKKEIEKNLPTKKNKVLKTKI